MTVADKYAIVKLGEHVIDMTNGSQVEFITKDGESILVHTHMHKDRMGDPENGVKPHPQAISRAVLLGDGKTERTTVFQDWIILPASAVVKNGKVLKTGDGVNSLDANGVAYYPEQRLLVPLYPAVYVYEGVSTKESEVGYRTEGRNKSKGFAIDDIKVIVPDVTEPLPA